MLKSIDARSEESWQMASKIWEWAEPGYQETRSAALLAETFEVEGFTVRRAAAVIPTAFRIRAKRQCRLVVFGAESLRWRDAVAKG